MKSLILILMTVLFTLSPAVAHEFWLQPETFRPATDAKSTAIDIKVGMKFKGERWKGDLDKIVAIPVAIGSRKDSYMTKTGLKKPVINCVSEGPGQYLVGLTNKSSFIKLSASAFEKYVMSEGLERIVEERKKLGESKKAARELYLRCAKTLLQQGEQVEELSYHKEFGFPVEIIALDNPYKTGQETISFKLVQNGQPLQGALVKVSHKDGKKFKKKTLRTNKDGVVNLLLTQKGMWMLSSVHMVRSEDPRAEWQSYWASYTFGFK